MNRWLRCQVLGQMFSDERIISVRVFGNGAREFLVPRNTVNEEGAESRVRVRVFREPDATWAVLPTVYSDSVAIDETELVPA